MTIFRALIFFVATFWFVPTFANTEQDCEYNFGIVPQQSATVLAKKWIPILKTLSANTDCHIRFATNKDIPTFEKQLSEGYYDFAYMNPYHYTVFSEKAGYKAIAHRHNQPIRGIMVVRKDFDSQSADELLENKRIAFPSPAAFAATILNQAKLNQANIPFNPQYVSSHDSVYLSISKGLFVAGGGVMRTFNTIPKDVRDKLKVLWKTEPYTPHAIAAHSRVPTNITKRLANALVALASSPQGSDLLKSIKVKHGFVTPSESAWKDVADLNIKLIN